MKLVIDANILFAALIKDSFTAELIISDELQLFAPEFLLEEFAKYENYIIEKTYRGKDDFKKFLEFLKEYITFIPQKAIAPFLETAGNFSPDPKDTVYIALALVIKSAIWSNDKKLKREQNQIEILTTKELVKNIRILKKKK